MDYRSTVDQQNAKNYGLNTVLDQTNKLAQMLQQKQQFQDQQDQQTQMQQAGFQQQKDMGMQNAGNEESIAKLKHQLGQQDIDQNFDKAQEMVDNNSKMGRKVNVKLGNVDVSQADTNPYLQQSRAQSHEGTEVRNAATKAFSTIDQQAQAVKATVDSLNLGNPTGDSAAVMNEVKAISGSSRGMLGLMQALGGHPTAATKMQDAMNYINNTAQSGLQPAQRDAMREFAFSRIPQLKQQHQSASETLVNTAPSYAPNLSSTGQLPSLVGSYGKAPKQALDDLEQLHTEYSKQGPKVSNSTTYSPAPSNLDKLKSFLGFGGQQPQQQAPPPVPSNYRSAPAGSATQNVVPQQPAQGAPMSFEEFKAKKAAGQL